MLHDKLRSPNVLSSLVALATVLYGIGIFAPAMVVVPKFGELTHVVSLFKPAFNKEQTFSIFDSICSLLRQGEYFIGGLILIFSVCFPLWKLGVLWDGIVSLRRGIEPTSELRMIERLGKFSLLDVYVMALLAIAVKGLPGGSEIHLQWGLIVFCLSVFLSMKITHWISEFPVSGGGGNS